MERSWEMLRMSAKTVLKTILKMVFDLWNNDLSEWPVVSVSSWEQLLENTIENREPAKNCGLMTMRFDEVNPTANIWDLFGGHLRRSFGGSLWGIHCWDLLGMGHAWVSPRGSGIDLDGFSSGLHVFEWVSTVAYDLHSQCHVVSWHGMSCSVMWCDVQR